MARRKKGDMIPEPMVVGADNKYEQAVEKARNPNMTLVGNPLADVTPEQGVLERIEQTNMERLYQDARKRRSPQGAVYAGFMQTRYGG